MFLDRLLTKNPGLATAAVAAHQDGTVLANTYLLDLDAMTANAASIRREADRLGLSVYLMSKQFGRNPDACRAVIKGGIPAAVAVDVQCMEALLRHQVPVGHVGHLVQPHRGAEDAVVAARPEVVTVFSLEVARRIGAAARRSGVTQPVLLRVQAPGDAFYFGHGGGFALDSVEDAARAAEAIDGLRVAGVTTFPCLLADRDERQVLPTHNLGTLVEAARRLRAAGFEASQVNAPGTNSASTLETLAAAGATHVEPGNALHGTSPLHLFEPDAPEVPAIVYVSEVSHLDGEDAYVFAAGYYADKVLGDYQLRAVVGRDAGALERILPMDVVPDGAISYYSILRRAASAGAQVGDTVVCCFRPQAFVTRARTQGVSGLHGAPGAGLDFGGRYDEEARRVEGVG